jgi:hypothetical protein
MSVGKIESTFYLFQPVLDCSSSSVTKINKFLELASQVFKTCLNFASGSIGYASAAY